MSHSITHSYAVLYYSVVPEVPTLILLHHAKVSQEVVYI